MFKNTQIKGYTYATRYIASWIKVGGKLQCNKDIDDFEEHHEHEPKIKQHKLVMIAFEIFKMVHTSPHSNFAKN